MTKQAVVNRNEGNGSAIFRARSKSEAARISMRDVTVYAVPIAAMIRAVAEYGDCLSFSLTSDGGQLCIVRLHDREALKAYVPKDATLPEALRAIAADIGVDYDGAVEAAEVAATSVQVAFL